jgi:hypothetical protein
MLSDEILLLIRPGEPALELCRLTNIGRPDASLETVCILSLPKLTKRACLRWATCYGEHPGHGLFSKSLRVSAPDSVGALVFPSTFMSTRRPPPPEGWGPRQQLRSVPADGIVSVMMELHGLWGYVRTNHLTVRCRSLLAFTNNKSAEAGEGEGTVPTVPWEEWGPKNTRVLEHNSHTWGTLVGERRVTVGHELPPRITVRDYNPFRVRRALARTGGPGNEIKLECGSIMKVVDEKSVYHKGEGEGFVNDIESSLPYVETVTPYPGCEGVFMDEDNLLVEVRTEVSIVLTETAILLLAISDPVVEFPFQAGERTFHLHRL